MFLSKFSESKPLHGLDSASVRRWRDRRRHSGSRNHSTPHRSLVQVGRLSRCLPVQPRLRTTGFRFVSRLIIVVLEKWMRAEAPGTVFPSSSAGDKRGKRASLLRGSGSFSRLHHLLLLSASPDLPVSIHMALTDGMMKDEKGKVVSERKKERRRGRRTRFIRD